VLHIYYGADSYSRTVAVAGLKAGLDTDGMLAINTVSFNGSGIDPDALIAACDTVPFLSSNRLVILTNYLSQAVSRQSRSRGSRRARAAEPLDAGENFLIAYVPRMPASTTLLLIDDALREDNSVLRALRHMGEVRAFPQLGEPDLLAWIAKRARDLGVTVEPPAARLLVQSVRSDLWTMAAELEKLSLYTDGRAISAADVRGLVASSQESNVFSLVDAVVAGRLEQALVQLRLLLQGGAAGPYLITMIARQYRQLIIVQDLIAAGAAAAVVADRAEIRSESLLRRVAQQARRFDPEKLLVAFERILEADLSIKRGAMDEGLVLELLVTDLTDILRH
jgi:DNA polymerase-3 subunit delta